MQTYREMGDDSSSVGQRLAHWRLAWEMGRERPLTGWGRTGYIQEKVRRVAAGLARPRGLTVGHVHKEALSLCLVGVSMPLSYIGFGFTQVFLAHNSGNMFYLFMCPLVLAALQRRRSGGPGPS